MASTCNVQAEALARAAKGSRCNREITLPVVEQGDRRIQGDECMRAWIRTPCAGARAVKKMPLGASTGQAGLQLRGVRVVDLHPVVVAAA